MLGVIAGLKKTTLDKILPAGAAAVRLAPSSLAVNAKLDSDFDGIPDVLEYQNGNSSSFSHDSDGDGFSDGAENDQGTNPNDANDKPEIEALIVTGNAEAGVEISQKRKIIIPAGSPNRLIVVALQSDEYPSYTSGDLCEGECPFNDQLRWLITLSNGETISGQVDVNDLHEKWETESDTFLGRSPVYFQEVKVVESKPDQDVVVEVEVGATNIEDGALPSTVMVGLLPVEVVELSPKVKDEDGNEIAGSEKPNTGKPLTPFVEVDPHANRIAHRELKVKIGEPLKGKKVTWTLEALPGATPATIRGEWADSPTHKDRFEASVAYGANGFRRISQQSGETTIADDGHTAIRVNVPPIGFNQVRIKIQIEGVDTAIDLIDMEVPGIVVIDPGHGGGDSGAVGRTDNSVLEKNLVLSYSLKLRDELKEKFKDEKRNLRVKLTRDDDSAIELTERAPIARDEGADIFVSIHFNSASSTSARGCETFVERLASQASSGNPGANVDFAFFKILW